MSDPRLEDLGRRIRAAEKKFAPQITAYTSRKVAEQLAAGARYAIGHFKVYRDGDRWVSGPLYPGPAHGARQPQEASA